VKSDLGHRWDVFQVLLEKEELIGGIRGKNQVEALRNAKKKWPSISNLMVKRRRSEK